MRIPSVRLAARQGQGRLRIPIWLRIGAPTVLLVIVVWFIVVPQFIAAEGALDSLAHVSLPLSATAVTLELASLLVYSALTSSLLGAESPRYFTLLRIDVTALGVNHVLPGGSATSAATRFRLLGKAGVRPADALTAATIETTGSNIVLGVVFATGIALSLREFAENDYYVAAASTVLALLVAAAIAVWALTRHTDRSVLAARWVARRMPIVTEDAAERFVRTMARRVRELLTDPRRMAVVLSLAVANWLLDAAALGVLFVAFGHPLGLGPLLTVYGVGSILALLPITPGGLGIVEGVLVPATVAFGAPRSTALLAVIGWRLLQYWLPIPLSFLAYLSLTLDGAGRRRRSRSSSPPQ
ncbi:lysylphosphatidylglycerol synthase transmembrane domain-containing protein [Lacisediminihabitans profunda]|uniref:UPF0104 family protein n=1 Tax=Lacisediminihabitans profunda TaxID=2594790 RepID=A0A5C8UU68_9MICO|nr:YbhN family protein [Lacisediminihabitans profunda]TXN31891.1 UPF0104 family protein [Lacisediminihabitans profunda]